MDTYCRFPKDFLWGCATSSYQVEGAVKEDGRGPSVWDTFSHAPGRTPMDMTGDVSVDQYHRHREDIALMKWMGIKAHRFSVSWPRIFPRGTGAVNEPGLAYYDRLVDEFLANGIEPWMTCFHWDLPQTLEDDLGGWRSRDTARYFADYVACITKRLSDRVTRFFTINEFMCFTDLGYSAGIYPPGLHLPPGERNRVRHHALLAHGLAVQAIRANARRRPSVGLAENITCCVPVIETDEHIAASRTAMRVMNAPFLTAVLEGRYHEAYLQAEGANAPAFTDDDMKIIGAPLDFVGVNLYAPTHIRSAPDAAAGFAVAPHPETYPRIGMPWLYVGPQILYWGPRHLKEIWDVNTVYCSENGCASDDRLTEDGQVYDTDRVMYLRSHFVSAHRAVSEGWPLKGYFVWSLLDNFEWTYGYTKRFGLVYVKYDTLERIPKLSAKFYKEVIARNAVV